MKNQRKKPAKSKSLELEQQGKSVSKNDFFLLLRKAVKPSRA